jgi:signal transduction histidine kinase/CheY-like chemotaxis protein
VTEGVARMPRTECKPLLSLRIRSEPDIVVARQRARQVTALLGLAAPDQVGLATAVSEIARNAVLYAGEARIDFEMDLSSRPQFLWVQVGDEGPGITDLDRVLAGDFQSKTGLGMGLSGARRLTDKFEISSSRSEGTVVRFGKALAGHSQLLDMGVLGRLGRQLAQQPAPELRDALQQQNQDLIQTLEALRSREGELQGRGLELERLNLELEETNRGVVALYAELEERATALRRADELKSQFLSYVSHEFRTPVNSVMALTHLLLRRTDGELTSEQEKQVIFIRKAVEGLAEMVNDLLDLAKVESGKTEVRNSIVEVSQVLGAVRALMRPLATNDAVTLTFEEPPPALVVETDETKLGQILRNLVSNALKFTEKGEVRVSVSAGPESNLVSFVVQDTGIGIAPEHCDVIFQEFSQIHHSLQGRVKGTGLGLPLSRKLAALMLGTLEVSSQQGLGSTFVLTLPREVSKRPADLASPRFYDKSVGAILVVDDDEAARYVCRKMFRGTKYRIMESSALEAAERARFERPELIILDLMMPGRTGFEVLEELKAEPSTREIPVIIHTSKTLTEADRTRLSGRHLGVLPKSGNNRREALVAIRTVLGDASLFRDEPEFASNVSGIAESR